MSTRMPINVVALVKGDEQYAFIYDDASVPQLLQTLGRYAADPELSFEWKDAARLSCAARGKEYTPPRRTIMDDEEAAASHVTELWKFVRWTAVAWFVHVIILAVAVDQLTKARCMKLEHDVADLIRAVDVLAGRAN